MRSIACAKIVLIAALAGVGCDQASKFPSDGDPEQSYSIAQLKSRCTKQSVKITAPVTISGTIIGTGEYGEFEKTLVIEDATGGISIAADYPLFADEFPFGALVYVSCNGLTLCDYGGKIELGTTPGEYGAERIPRDELHRYIRLLSSDPTTPDISTYMFAEISSAQIDTYVRFDGVRFTTQGRWCAADPVTKLPVTTEHRIMDDQGRTFTVRVLASCDYATEPLPQGKGSLNGVIDYFGGKYTLRMTNRKIKFIDSEGPPTTYPSMP